MNRPALLAELIGRCLLASLFAVSGMQKLAAYSDTAAYMSGSGVPPALLPAVIVLEIAGAIALVAGWKMHVAAIALAVFTLAAGLMFHLDLRNEMQTIMLLKNLSIAGGLWLIGLQGGTARTERGRERGRHD